MKQSLFLGFYILLAGNALYGGNGQAHPSSLTQTTRVAQEDFVSQGRAAFERGEIIPARILFEKALKRNPNDIAAITLLGVIADQNSDLLTAERYFAQAARIAPESSSAHNNYGAVLLRRGLTKQAATEFETSLRLEPQQPSALINLAQIRFAENTPASLRASRDLLQQARRLTPDAGIARSLLIIALRLDEREQVPELYRDYAANIVNISQNNQPDEANARGTLGLLLLKADFPIQAEAELVAAVNLASRDADVITGLARLYLQRKDIIAAGRTLETAVAGGVNAAPVYAALADVYEAADRPDNAIAAMRLAIERAPESEAYRFRYAMLLTDTQAPAAAVIRVQEALKEFPKSARLYLALGIAHLSSGKNDEATRAFTTALEINPMFAPALAYLASTYAERGQYVEAVKCYERAIEIDSQLAVAYYLAAETLLKQNSPDTARIEKYLTRAVEIDPKFAAARLSLAKVFFRANKIDDSAKQLEEVVKLDASLVEAYYQLGRVYARQKRAEESKTAYATFKRMSDEQKLNAQTKRRDIVRRLADVRF